MTALDEEQRLLLSLVQVPGLGERGLAALLDSGIPLPRLFHLPAEELAGRFALSERAAAAIASGAAALRLRVAPLERVVDQHGIRLLRRGTAEYPRALASTADPPPVLFAYGNLELLAGATVAFLSSKGESRAGLERTADLAGAFADAGLAIVAGHNRPCYRAAVSGAKARGGGRVVVLDRGLLDAFGGDLHRDLFPAARIWGYDFERERSLALSPYPLSSGYAGLRNRRRDRMVADLAAALVAVEVRRGGVMEDECRAAGVRGKPVYVLTGPDVPEGNLALLADGFPPLPDEDPARSVRQRLQG